MSQCRQSHNSHPPVKLDLVSRNTANVGQFARNEILARKVGVSETWSTTFPISPPESRNDHGKTAIATVRCPGNWRVYADPVPADQRREAALVPRGQGTPGERGRYQGLRSGLGA
jgi:hypothetical protein